MPWRGQIVGILIMDTNTANTDTAGLKRWVEFESEDGSRYWESGPTFDDIYQEARLKYRHLNLKVRTMGVF